MPAGPTTSGGSGELSWTARMSYASSYSTTSSVTWMSGWVALKSSTTACSTSTWAGSSPAPRQQNQRISTTSPVGPPSVPAGPVASGSSVWPVCVPHAETMSDSRTIQTPNRINVLLMNLYPPNRLPPHCRDGVRSAASLLSPNRGAPVATADAGHRHAHPIGAVQPVGAHDVALQVVAGAIAPHEAACCLDRRTVGCDGHAVD